MNHLVSFFTRSFMHCFEQVFNASQLHPLPQSLKNLIILPNKKSFRLLTTQVKEGSVLFLHNKGFGDKIFFYSVNCYHTIHQPWILSHLRISLFFFVLIKCSVNYLVVKTSLHNLRRKLFENHLNIVGLGGFRKTVLYV